MSTPPNNLLISNLMEFGLSEKEAKVYISLLEFEIATVQEIAKASGINRSSAYVVLDSLKQKGLVSFSDDKNVQQYIPSSPNALLKTAEELAQKQEQIKKNIDAIVPDLKALHKGTKQRPVVRVFEGKDGLISIFEDSLSSREREIRVVSNLQNLTGILPPTFFLGYVIKRMKNGLKMFGIHPYNKIAKFLLSHAPKTNDEQVFIPEKNFTSPSDIAIYDNKISFMSNKNGGVGVLIESEDMAEAMKQMFDLAYGGAKKSQENIKI